MEYLGENFRNFNFKSTDFGTKTIRGGDFRGVLLHVPEHIGTVLLFWGVLYWPLCYISIYFKPIMVKYGQISY